MPTPTDLSQFVNILAVTFSFILLSTYYSFHIFESLLSLSRGRIFRYQLHELYGNKKTF